MIQTQKSILQAENLSLNNTQYNTSITEVVLDPYLIHPSLHILDKHGPFIHPPVYQKSLHLDLSTNQQPPRIGTCKKITEDIILAIL